MDTLLSIIRDADAATLDAYDAAIKRRREVLARAMVRALDVGDTVRFIDGTHPTYLAGLRATVTARPATGALSVHVKIVDADARAARRFGYGPFRATVKLIERV